MSLPCRNKSKGCRALDVNWDNAQEVGKLIRSFGFSVSRLFLPLSSLFSMLYSNSIFFNVMTVMLQSPHIDSPYCYDPNFLSNLAATSVLANKNGHLFWRHALIKSSGVLWPSGSSIADKSFSIRQRQAWDCTVFTCVIYLYLISFMVFLSSSDMLLVLKLLANWSALCA